MNHGEFALDPKCMNSRERVGSGAALRAAAAKPMLCSARRPTRAEGWVEWMGGLHHQREDAARSEIRDFFFIEEKKR